MESFQNRPAAYTIIVNCQLSIVNSAKPPNSNFPLSCFKSITETALYGAVAIWTKR